MILSMKTITSYLYRMSYMLILASIKLADYPKIFKILADFMASEPAQNFGDSPPDEVIEGVKKVPLVLNEAADKHLKSALSAYSNIYNAAKAHMPYLSMAYLIGQFLTAVATHFDFIEVDGKMTPEIKDVTEKLYKIWGSRYKFNAHNLYKRFQNMSTDQARKEMENMLKRSSEITKPFESLGKELV